MDAGAIFWDRLAEMPWVEAEQECVSRREYLTLQLAVIHQARAKANGPKEKSDLGIAIAQDAAQLTKLNEHIKYLRKVQDRVSWSKAVEALYGKEAWAECKAWMAGEEHEIRRRSGSH